MALWQASRLSDSVVGFEAQSPGHARSAAGGDTRLFRMLYRGTPSYYPILERSRRLWAELEADSGQHILTRCGGLSIGTADGPYLPHLLETTRLNGADHEILSREAMAERYPQHSLRPDDRAVFDPHAGVLRTDRAVTAAVDAAQANGATVLTTTPIDGIREADDGVVITSGSDSWRFENVIISSGAWSQQLMPDYLKAVTETWRLYLSWFVARDAAEFAPDRFPIFIRISGDRSMYGAPSVDGVTVKATLDGRGAPTPQADAVPRELTAAEIAETTETVTEFLPGLIPSIVRSDAFPDLFTADHQPPSRPTCGRTAGSTAPPGFPAPASRWPPASARSPRRRPWARGPSRGSISCGPNGSRPPNASDRCAVAIGAQSPVSVGPSRLAVEYPASVVRLRDGLHE